MSLRKVYIIGNNATNESISDGGRIKIRLYSELIKKCSGQVEIIDLCNWKKRIFYLLHNIKKAVKEKAIILIMAGPKGCRFIIPLVNKLKTSNTRVLFCPLGVGTLDKLFEKMTPEQISLFLNNEQYESFDDSKMAKQLSKLDVIFPQNELIANAYRKFYKLDNVVVVENFRDVSIEKKEYEPSDKLKLVYVSRICENKGIFDLLEAVDKINKERVQITLTIYGDMQLSCDDEQHFYSYLSNNIRYNGIINQADAIKVLKKYDLFVLPTKYHGEGTSGSLIESLIAGTPVLISSYSQAKLLIDNKKNGFIYEINNVSSLIEKLEYIINNRSCLESVGLAAQELSKKYLFKNNKEVFLKTIYGE